MSKQATIDLSQAITRRSLMIADSLALGLTREDLEYLFQFIGLFWLSEQVVPGTMVKIGVSRLELVQDAINETIEERLATAARHAIEVRERYESE